MKNFTITLYLLLLSASLIGQDQSSIFSDLSSRRVGLFPDLAAVVTDQGIIYAFRPHDPVSRAKYFYFIDFEGQVIDSLVFSELSMLGDLFESEGRYFFGGIRRTPPGEPSLKVLIQFDSRMSVLDYQEWEDIVPVDASGIMGFINPAPADEAEAAKIAIQSIHAADADTLFSVFFHLLADPDLGPFPYGTALQFERVGINHDQVEILPSTPAGLFSGACITEKYIYAFGQVGGTVLDGGLILNAGPVFRQTRQGTDPVSLDFGNTLHGYFGSGVFAQYHDGKIYCNYSNQRLPISESFCDDSNDYSSIIDVRDEEFNLIKHIDVPLCRAVPAGRAPFAFGPDGSIYHTTSTHERDYFLFKFDAELNEIWRAQLPYLGKDGMPMSSILLPDGSIVVSCIEDVDQREWILRLYKVSPDGLITSTTTLGNATTAPTFHPNPFTNELSLLAPPERPLRVDVFGMDGRPLGRYSAQDGRLQLGHLPGGAYVLRMSDVESGAFIGAQQVVKVGR